MKTQKEMLLTLVIFLVFYSCSSIVKTTGSKSDTAKGLKDYYNIISIWGLRLTTECYMATILKVVNTTAQQKLVEIKLKGITKVSPEGTIVVIRGNKPEYTNTITDPEKIIPVTSKISGIAPVFTKSLDPYSISVLQLQTAPAIKTK